MSQHGLRSSFHRGLRIRGELPEDFEEITAVVVGAFGGDGATVAALVERIRTSPEYEPELALVATDASGVVGHAMLSWVGLLGGSRDRVLNLTPLSVRPDRQRRGVGTLMVTRLLELADEREEPVVMVEGIPAYYPRFGFERASALGFKAPHAHVPDDAFMAKRLRAYRPSVRGRLVYPAAFDIVAP